VFISGGSSKALQKTFCKKSCRNVFTKESTKDPKPIFLDFVFITVLGHFSVTGVQNTIKINIKKIDLTLVLFWPLTYLPTGVPDLFWRPLAGLTSDKGHPFKEKTRKTKRRTTLNDERR
jgi:hypothetical protein